MGGLSQRVPVQGDSQLAEADRRGNAVYRTRQSLGEWIRREFPQSRPGRVHEL